MRKTSPLIRCSVLSGEIYCITRYKVNKTRDGREYVLAHEKFDVTADAMIAIAQRKKVLRDMQRRKRR